MANETREIGEVLKTTKILLLDIEGTTTSITFVKDKLFVYAEEKVKQFLEREWDNEEVKTVITSLRESALKDVENKVEGAVPIPGEDTSKEELIEAIVNNVKWQTGINSKSGSLKELQGMIWKKGYEDGDIIGHVYDDVPAALEQWHSVEGQKVYIYSSGSVQAQKLLFGHTVSGDLLKYIDGHFDTAVGGKLETSSYKAIVEQIGCKPDEMLFLTDIENEAAAAREAGLHVALLSRPGNSPLSPTAVADYPVLQSFAQLSPSNKRKQQTQDELPAKILKTEAEIDVKAESAVSPNDKPSPADTNKTAVDTNKTAIEQEKMEVDDEVVKPSIEEKTDIIDTTEITETTDENKVEKSIPEIVVKEVTDKSDTVDVPVCDVEPVIEEKLDEIEETKEQATEAMDTEISETSDTVQNKEKMDAAEESPPPVVTEIEEITEDKGSLDEMGEIIDDLEPVITEPEGNDPSVSVDMEDLQNVGDVLDKECDEILSKVQNVTNLDSIPLKPLLNPIAEETMEDNTDSNDIVDRILDTELELEMKQCDDEIDLNSVSEITDTKMDAVENGVEESKDATAVTETEKACETVPEVTNSVPLDTPEEKVEISCSKEATDVKEDSAPISEATKKDDEIPQEKSSVETVAVPEPDVVDSNTMDTNTKEDVNESQVNGNTSNSESEVNGATENGELSKSGETKENEELSSRLSVENGEETVNGSNGDSTETVANVEKKVEEESNIKVKTVATDETNAPIEQPTEA